MTFPPGGKVPDTSPGVDRVADIYLDHERINPVRHTIPNGDGGGEGKPDPTPSSSRVYPHVMCLNAGRILRENHLFWVTKTLEIVCRGYLKNIKRGQERAEDIL
jgi:hypothetical protein